MSSTNYIALPIETDANVLTANSFDELMASIPGWIPQEGNLDVWIIEVLNRRTAEANDVATRVAQTIFRYFGRSLINIQPIDGAPASMQSTWSVRDVSGYTIPAGTLVGYPTSGTDYVYFQVAHDVVIAPGQLSTGTGEVVLTALNNGVSGNNLSPAQVNVVDSLAWVSSVTTTTTSSGGVEAETDGAYLSRLHDELKLLSPRPILPDDFAVLARRVPGVGRSIAIDGYNPNDQTFNNERMVTVALADAQGSPVSSDVKAAVVAYLSSPSLREVNFVVWAMDPTYVTVDISATLKARKGADLTVVQSAAIAATTNYLNPINWDWSTVVRYNELISLLDQVPGVDYVDSIATPPADVILPGVAALVQPGTMEISVF